MSYHAHASRDGAVGYGLGSATPARAWATNLGGAVRGQALIFDGRIYAATESNRVVALRPSDGAVMWSATVGTPLTNVHAVAGCGNIDPLGITSTPVIDPNAGPHGTVYVVAEIDDGGGVVHHQMVGLDAATGAIRLSVRVDPPLSGDQRAVHLLNRASLAMTNGRVYVSYAGNFGDCGVYHGWVVSIDPAHPHQQRSFEVASDGQGGAIWQSGGAPAIGSHGDLYLTTGNANPDPPQGGPDPKKYTESVVRLSPDLRPLAWFKDRVAGGDEDLSTSNPVLLPDGLVFAVGKTDIGFLLHRDTLRPVAQIHNVCGSDPDGGPAYDAQDDKLFVPCRAGGIQIIDLADRTLGAKLPGADSSPVLLGGTLWALDSGSDTLAGYNPTSGDQVASVAVGSDVPVFNSPSALPGMILVPTSSGVTAFH